MKKKKYDLIFSCGGNCMVSINLRNNRLQFRSYPFDWTLLFNPILFAKYLETDFNDYFLKENLELTHKVESDISPYDVYADKTNKIIYIHDFDKNMKFEDSFPIVQKKYKRRISRMLEDIKKSQKILMVYATEIAHDENSILKSFIEIR